jgi:hypothetical protein
MALARFKTDRTCWVWISLVLFVVPWLLPIFECKGDPVAPGMHWITLFTHPTHFDETLGVIGILSLLFGIPAMLIGWVLQAMFVMVRDARRQRMRKTV